MGRETTRGGRGWIYAILVAICLLIIFYIGGVITSAPRVAYRDPRTTVLKVSTTPKNPSRIATADIPLDIEPLEKVLELQSWSDYRTDYAHSIALLEPPAGIKLLAPVSGLQEEVMSPLGYGRDPLQLANDAANDSQVNASLVSAVREGFAIESIREIPKIDPRTSPSGRKTWPPSPQLRDSMRDTFEVVEQTRNEGARVALNQTSTILEELVQCDLKDDSSRGAIEQLDALAVRFAELANENASASPQLSACLVRLSYSLQRRCAVWLAIHDCVVRGEHLVSLRNHHVDSTEVLRRIRIIDSALVKTGDIENWRNYLMLDRLHEMATQGITGSEDHILLAREFLARVLNSNTLDSQREVLTSPEVHALADLMHPLTIRPVDYVRVLDDIEILESDPTHRCSRGLSDAIQSLRFSEHPEQTAIGHAIAVHYRNANIRVAVSEAFVNRMLPKQNAVQKPVRQNILGADTRGASQVETQLNVDFLPDETAWKMALVLNGDIASNTRSSRNGATFYNSSHAIVNAKREIVVNSAGFRVDGFPANVQSNDSLKKFSTEWDSLPFLGDVIRNIAHQEFVESRPIAKKIMHSTIARETDKEFDAQLQSKLRESQRQLESRLIGPLQGLQLHPSIVDMQSTDTRLIVRYRVAGEDQVAAHTVRPIAPADSLLSMQVHQSAFNNIASQIVLAGRDWTAQELADQISELLQQPRFTIPVDQAEDIRVRFHANNPITVEFDKGKLFLTLRIDSLEQPGRIHLKDFMIRASYTPAVRGLQASFERDGTISIDGIHASSLSSRDRIPLRAIFTKVLTNREPISMVAQSLINDERAAGLAVSQLEMRDGWFAIAISEENSPHVAFLQDSLNVR